MSKKNGLILVIAAVALVIYNIIVFAAAGFAGHNATFWIAYVFVYVAVVTIGVIMMLMRDEKMRNRDILFGLPLFKHSILYIFIQIIVSAILMIFSESIVLAVAIIIQIVVLSIYLFLATTCLIAKEIVTENDAKIKTQVLYVRKIQLKADEAMRISEDAETKKAFAKLSEKIRYSDPGSNEQIADIEKELEECIDEAVGFAKFSPEDALNYCRKAEELLEKRNEMCRLFKL